MQSTLESNTWNDESVRKDQLADPEIKRIIEFKESSNEKSPANKTSSLPILQRSVPGLLRTFSICEMVFYIENGSLMTKKNSGGRPYKKSESASTGTMCGVTLRSGVTCDSCAERKGPRKRTRGRLQLYNVGAPFEQIAFDILGLLPRSSDGSSNILVVMDYFTKWPEAYPIPNQEAPTFAEILAQHWISRYGEILYNCTSIKEETSILQFARDCDWDKKLPFFRLAYRSAVQETTGYSPSQILFGHDVRLPGDLMFSWLSGAPLALEEYVDNLQTRVEEMHHLAKDKISMASEMMKVGYDARAIGHDFHEGDKVWL
ncbi:retrovirus-related Pol polyprotein from transposon 412 [Trichonephila clavipes]|nr:retrovirus-related Pol polyprotein from transposon 412 [Trichonephila clavipes]